MSDFLTTTEAAQTLRCHEKTIRRMIVRGELRAVYIGGRYLIDPSDLPIAAPVRRPPPSRKPGKAKGPVTAALRQVDAA